MAFMHIVLLFCLLGLSLIICLICFVDNLDRPKKIPKKVTYLMIGISLFLAIWAYGASTRPNVIKKTEILTPVEITTVNGVMQLVNVTDEYGIRTVNLTDYFHCLVPKGAKVKRVEYKSGPYCGVSFFMGPPPLIFEVVH